MTPAITRTGLMLLAVGAAFVISGALTASWPLLALGFAQLSAILVLYVLFAPPAAMLRRRNLELAWWVPAGELSGGALLIDRPMNLHLMLRNLSPFAMHIPRLQVMASSAVDIHENPIALRVPGRKEVRLKLRVTPRAAGHWFFQGAMLQVTDRFGIFAIQLYYPNLLGLKVFPMLGISRQPIPFRPRTGASHERVGQRLLRQRGLGSDLREIRDHVAGDPFKRIAWKATARTGKLMVRELESEILVTHWVLLDISSTMRSQRPGQSKLDYGLNLAASFARVALDAGDRVGLITFDHRVYSKVKPGEGQAHLIRIVEQLMELNNIVDEDLTDFTDAELYAAVAEYLAYQEGVGVGVKVSSKAANESSIMATGFVQGPRGQIYDAIKMERAVKKALAKRRDKAPRISRTIKATSTRNAQLRLFCHQSGLEIPYRHHTPLLPKSAGMAEAITTATRARQSHFVVLISDLEQVEPDNKVLDALRLARMRGHSVLNVAPYAPDFFPESETDHAQRVQNIFTLKAQRQRKETAKKVERIGVPVISAAPGDLLPLVLRKLARIRVMRSGRPAV